jgi:polyisoprenoid-binding protein YceI
MATQAMTGRHTWAIDAAHSEAGFAVKHLMISTVKGRFGTISGQVVLDEANPEASTVEATIDATTIDTRSEQRDAHLRSPDFFDVETYPTITFRSTKVDARGNGEFRVTGDLTIRDVTKQVALEVEETGRATDPWGGERIGFTAITKLDRADFGLTWNAALEAGGVMVGNEVKITLEIQAVLA